MNKPASVSIVIASQNACASISECLTAVLAQLDGMDAEILVADASTDGTDRIVSENFPQVKLIRGGSEDLIPNLWGLGMDKATAPIIAITNAQCIPSADWLANILRSFRGDEKTCAVGGPIHPPVNGSSLDWAIYFSRFTAFMPPVKDGRTTDLPGDNAAYAKEALDGYWTDRQSGFWETLFHHNLNAHNQPIYISSALKVHLAHTEAGDDFYSVRMRHGRHYGSTRPGTTSVLRVARIIAAPILVPYLIGRMGLRVAKKRSDLLGKFVISLPWLFVFTCGWSVGEVQGYLVAAHE